MLLLPRLPSRVLRRSCLPTPGLAPQTPASPGRGRGRKPGRSGKSLRISLNDARAENISPRTRDDAPASYDSNGRGDRPAVDRRRGSFRYTTAALSMGWHLARIAIAPVALS